MDFLIINKEVTIFLILSPFFISVFLLAYLIKKGRGKFEKYPLYWLILTVLLSILGIYMFLQKKGAAKFYLVGYWVSGAYSTYLTLKKKSKK